MRRSATALVPAVVLLATLSGCGGSNDRTVLVLAASSLTDAFSAIESEFESANPGIDVELSFGGSSTLRIQVEQGAPAGVVALADTAPMEALRSDELVGDPVTFATNSIVLATPVDNPGSIDGIEDLADPELLVGVCAPQVPCGRYADQVLTQVGVAAAVDTQEPDVRALTAKLAEAELDAGLVYASDVDSFGNELAAIDLPPDVDVRAAYSIATVATPDSPASADAERFVEFVLSPDGQQILADSGFGPA